MSGSDPTLRAAVELFNRGQYLAAHELFEELWEATEGADSDFHKGLIQACIALHHLGEGNREGAAKLYGGHRRYLAGYLPAHLGLDVARFLEAMQRSIRPLLARQGDGPVSIAPDERPRLEPAPGATERG